MTHAERTLLVMTAKAVLVIVDGLRRRNFGFMPTEGDCDVLRKLIKHIAEPPSFVTVPADHPKWAKLAEAGGEYIADLIKRDTKEEDEGVIDDE